MVLGLIAGISAASSIASSFGSARSARRTERTLNGRLNQATGFVDQGIDTTTGFSEEGFEFLEDARDDAEATRSRVLGYADDALRAEVDRVTRKREEAKSRTSQQLVSRGLFSSSVAANANRGIDSDADRALGEITASFANRRGAIDQQTSGAYQQVLTQMAQFMRAQGLDIAGLRGQQASVVAQAPVARVPDGLETAGGALAGVGGAIQGYQQATFDRDLIAAIGGGE